MWQIKDPQVNAITLDFSSSGQGMRQAHQLVADGVELINAIELVNFDDEDTQFLVCQECGYMHCKPGDWVSVRRTESVVLILPSSDYVWPEDADRDEYRPPLYINKRGIACMDLSTYESLRAGNSSFPKFDSIQPLSMKEATLMFHWEAPNRVLGEPPEILVRRDIVGGSSDGHHLEHLERMQNLMQVQYENESPAQLRAVASNEQVISLYLVGVSEFSEWNAMVFDGSEYRLIIDEKYVIDAP